MPVERRAARQADEVELEQLGETHLPAPRQAMAGRRDQHQPVGPERMAFQAGGEGRLRGDADVGVARGDGGCDRRTLAVLEIEVDRGIGREEIREQPGQMLRQGRCVGQHAHAALQSARIGRKLAAHGVDLLQHDAGMVEQAAPGIGQLHAAPAALQQRHVEHLLHAADARAGRRQGKVRALGAVRDAAGLGDVAEQAEIGEIEAHGRAYVQAEGRVHILRIVLMPWAANRPPWPFRP